MYVTVLLSAAAEKTHQNAFASQNISKFSNQYAIQNLIKNEKIEVTVNMV